MAEYGIKQGLAQSFGYDQRVQDMARQNNAMRQAQIYSENKAKLLADDFDYNNAMNAWDNTAVKGFAQNKLKEIGKFMRENPDFESNLEKRVAYKNLTKELKDNKALNEGLQVDANIKAMQGYMNDPKNAPLVQSEDFEPIKRQYENYLKTGSIDGNTANRKLFTFTPPEELVDTTPLLSKYAQMTALNGQDKRWLAKGAGTIHQFATDMDKAAAAEGAINDRELGKYLQKEYNDYTSKLGENVKPLTLKQYVVNKMQPYFKGDEYKNFNYSTSTSDGGDKKTKGGRNYFKELLQRTQKAGGAPVAASAEGAKQYLTGGQDKLNTAGMLYEKNDGNFVQVAGGLLNDFTTAGSEAKWTPNGLMMSVIANVPVSSSTDLDQLGDFMGENVYDFGIWSDNVNKGFDKNAKVGVDKNGNPAVSVKLWVPVESTNTNTSAAYNHGMHAKAEDVTSEFESTGPISKSALIKAYGQEAAQDFINKYGSSIELTD